MMVSKEGRDFLAEVRKTPAFGDEGNEFNLAGLREGMGTRQDPSDRSVRCFRTEIDGLPCEWVVAPKADPNLRLLYLHGGGYVSGSADNYLPLAAALSVEAGCAVLLPDYGLAPENPFPRGIEDCVRAHEWLVDQGPDGAAPARATFIAGDSAGGGLTLATMLVLRDRGHRMPICGIPLSACTDLTLSSPSTRDEKDPICSAQALKVFADLYLGKADPRDPLASPLYGDLTGLPPILLQVGEHEMLRDDSIRFAEKARADGVDVTLEVWPGMVHVFQIRGLPESREAISRIAEFMRASASDR
ncbi:MAG: alpha/beta hydrolase [Candidatus Latescibacteria bacterium]|jgi:epsilon-lactone hydrolase|nr:alpha/beta hydrolase [Candidatus Latescibacterota bacterium]